MEFKQTEYEIEVHSSWRFDSDTTACNILLMGACGSCSLISNGKCVFQSSSISLSLCCYSANTRDRKSLWGFCWWDCSFFHWTYCQHHMGQVLSFIESDLIRDITTWETFAQQDTKYLPKIDTVMNNRLSLSTHLPSILKSKTSYQRHYLDFFLKYKHQSSTNDQRMHLEKTSGVYEDFR